MRKRAYLLPVLLAPLLVAACAGPSPSCVAPGRWISPGTLQAVADPLTRRAAHPVVLLGERHDSVADHRWELATITRLHEADPSLVLGFEMFPRSDQAVLDLWVDGRLSEAGFLERSDWKHVWGFDASLYLPIFRFARDHRVPMLALNVSDGLVRLVGRHGGAGVAQADREGIGTPAPPRAAYRASLESAMSGHSGMAMTPERLAHFIDAQLVWDRAMAEAIATQRAREPDRPVVAMMGEGHVENREGVPHQLDSLGVAGALVLLPVQNACAPPGRNYADALYTE